MEDFKQKLPPNKCREKYIKLHKNWARSFNFKVNGCKHNFSVDYRDKAIQCKQCEYCGTLNTKLKI